MLDIYSIIILLSIIFLLGSTFYICLHQEKTFKKALMTVYLLIIPTVIGGLGGILYQRTINTYSSTPNQSEVNTSIESVDSAASKEEATNNQNVASSTPPEELEDPATPIDEIDSTASIKDEAIDDDRHNSILDLLLLFTPMGNKYAQEINKHIFPNGILILLSVLACLLHVLCLIEHSKLGGITIILLFVFSYISFYLTFIIAWFSSAGTLDTSTITDGLSGYYVIVLINAFLSAIHNTILYKIEESSKD